MTPNQLTSGSPIEAARDGWQATGDRRRRLSVLLLVALVSVGFGAGAMLLAMRFNLANPRASAATVPKQYSAHAGGGQSAPAAMPAGASPHAIYLSPARQQLIGVRTDEVVHRALEQTIRATGVLAYDETRVTEVHTKIAGWIERVHVDFVGKPVRRGQPLLCLYSPELVATQNEYLLALKAQAELSKSRFEETRTGVHNLLAAARERLKLWDVSDAQIAELETSGQASKTITLYSPFNGIVLERNTFAGQYLSPEMSAVKIADLATIWVVGEIFESELSRVGIGQQATVEFPHAQGTRTVSGKITFVYPDIDPQTRRAKIRIEFRNPALTFKPGSYVTMLVKTATARALAIPSEAVIDTGETQYAILALGDGFFEPRRIKVGSPIGEFYPVLEGIEHGDRVVTSAQFLIDSETNLKAAMQSMVPHGHEVASVDPRDAPPPPERLAEHAGHR